MECYYLNEDKTYRNCSLQEWEFQFNFMDRHVADNIINGYRVSTVWLGIDHNIIGRMLGEETPLFETMIFRADDRNLQDLITRRYSTWDNAKYGHQWAIDLIKNGFTDEQKFIGILDETS